MSIGAPQFESLPGFSPPSTLGPHRAADYWKLSEGEPVELILGRLVVSPSPDTYHQTILMCLASMFLDIAKSTGGRAFVAPMDVVLSDESIVQPDLIYVSKQRRDIVKQRIEGAPDLVVEVLSESNVRRDRIDKLNLYAQHGVSEYWIIDPHESQFDFMVNRDGRFEVQPQQDDRYQSPRLAELAINLADFWAEVQHCVDDGSSA